MDLYRKPDSRYWFVDFTIHGRRYRKSTKQTSKTAAFEVGSDLYRTLSRAPDINMELTVKGFANEHFLPWVEKCGREPKTKEDYQYGWSLLRDQSLASMRMDAVKAHHVDMVVVAGSPSTHNCALRTLRRMFNIAIDLGVISKKPKIHMKRENKRTMLVEPAIEDRIASVLAKSKRKGALQVAMYVILDAGMRPAEIAQMRVEHLDFERGLICVPKSKTQAGERYLPMTSRLKSLLFARSGARDRGWVFPSPRYVGKPIQRQALTQAWRRACNEAGISQDVKLYCARHTFGTDAMEITKNPFKVMTMLGHTSLATTQRYQHHEIAEVGNLMDERNLERKNRGTVCGTVN